MKRIFFGILASIGVLGAVLLVKGCSPNSSIVTDVLVRPNLHGTVLEQIAYHKNEISKYRAAIERQEALSKEALADGRMKDFRAATNLKRQYTFKVAFHRSKMESLMEKSS